MSSIEAIIISLAFIFIIWHIKKEKDNLLFLLNEKQDIDRKKLKEIHEELRELNRIKIRMESMQETINLQKREIMVLKKRLDN